VSNPAKTKDRTLARDKGDAVRFVARRPLARYPSPVRVRRWLLAAVAAAAFAAGVPLAREWYLARSAKLGPLAVTPVDAQVALRIGESVRFSAAAEGAVRYTWLVWGRPVSFTPTWSFTAAPEDAGWQQVTVEVTGRRGLRATRTWDVGVVPPTVPEIDVLEPAAGPLPLAAGTRTTFRARAHLPGARATDRLAFEWSLDDRPIFRDEQPAEEATSELALPGAEAGPHRLRLRVSEDGRTASLADWTFDVGAATPPSTIVASVAPEEPAGPPVPPTPVEPSPSVAAPVAAPPPAAAPVPQPPPHLVRAPGARRLEGTAGTSVVLEAHVEPADAPVTYKWAVDGKSVPADGGRLEYVPRDPGRRRVTLAVTDGRRTIGTDAWVVDIRPQVATAAPALRLVQLPAAHDVAGEMGRPVVLEARVEPDDAGIVYRWTVDGGSVPSAAGGRLAYEPARPGRHTIVVTAKDDRGALGHAVWRLAVREPATTEPSAPVAREEAPAAPQAPPPLAAADVRRWLEEYARAWSRKDVAALRRMGQIRSGAEAARLERYFRSVDGLEVDVRVLDVAIAGDRASVEFERTDTVTDPSGRRQQLRLPPMRKQIERTPDGLRFTVPDGAG
jgi:PKD domain-containing protein